MSLRFCGSLAHRVLLFAAAAAPGSQTASALTSGCRTSTKAGSRVAMRLRMTRRASTFSPICSRAASCSARQTSGGAIRASQRVISSPSALCNDRARSGRCSTRVITLDNSRDEATAPNARERERRARAPSAGSRSATELESQQVREAPLSSVAGMECLSTLPARSFHAENEHGGR